MPSCKYRHQGYITGGLTYIMGWVGRGGGDLATPVDGYISYMADVTYPLPP